jgi:hypothetical protein
LLQLADTRFKPVPDLVFPDKSCVTDKDDRDTGVSRGILAVHIDEPLLVTGIVVDFQGFKMKCRIAGLEIGNHRFQPFTVLTPVAIEVDGIDTDLDRSEVSRCAILRGQKSGRISYCFFLRYS